ncbi:transposase [Staphylococcus agnetis]|uniref:transposase n=1 Tax=Staphylococcus agnetis TaxID=985762 RepID=UPI00351EBCF7
MESLFPNTPIILDSFYIVQTVNEEINRYRIKIMNGFLTKDKYNKLKRHWKLLLKSSTELDRVNYQMFRLFSTRQNQ